MAVLKDLIVHGPSRFLNAAYYNKIDADEISTNTIALQKITAKTNNTISIVAGLVDVDGELHTKSFTNSNIATIDGSFYITPTISLQGDETNSYTAVATNNSISFSGTSYNLGSAYLDGGDSPIAWSTGSTVIVTGEVLVNNEWIPLGTLKGTLSTYSTNTNPNVVGITNILDSVNQSSKILGLIAGTGNLPYRKVKISLISVNRSGLKPLGIYMTAAGSNGRTFLDIYGGNLAESTTYGGLSTPVVRIGNLSGSNLPPVGNVTPNGWGIYTSNGFFTGTIVAKQGKIGDGTAAWTIGNDGNNRAYIYSGITNITSSGSTTGIYVGTNGISNYQSASQYVNLTGGKITAQGADIQGVLKADTGRIGGSSGWTIASQQISSGTLGSDNSMFLSTKNLSGTVSGKTFDSSLPAWRLTVGSNFGVTNTGSLYANNAVISGSIKATSFEARVNDIKRTEVNTNGLIIYDGIGTADANKVAVFGANGTQIGKNSQNRAVITDNAMLMQTGVEETPYFFAGQKSSSSGSTNVSEWFKGDGNQTVYIVSSTVYSVGGVYVNGSGVAYTRSARTFTLSSAPESDAAVEIQYHTSDNMKKYFSIGKRDESGSIGSYSTSIGLGNTASGEYSVSEGFSTKASDCASHSEGRQTWARGDSSHAEGNQTVAYGSYSHAEGLSTFAEGWSSHAEGESTYANGAYSHAQNYGTIAQGTSQTAIGRCNQRDSSSQYAFIIGNGSDNDNRSNALTVDWNGVASHYGDVTQSNIRSAITNLVVATNSGATIPTVSFTKKGNVAMLHMTIKSTGAIGGGSNIFQATLAAKYRPVQYTTGVGYYGNHPIIGRITDGGAVLVRNVSTSNVTLTDSVEVAFTYILKDYFV